jgi:signal transduction histidine kinase
MDREALAVLPRYLTAPILVIGAGLMAWVTYVQEPRPYAVPHAAGVVLALLLVVASFAIGMLRLRPGDRLWQRATATALAAGGTLMLLLQPGGVGHAGIFGAAFGASRLGRFGAALAVGTGAIYAVLLLRRDNGAPLVVGINLLGFAAAYGYSLAVQQARANRAEQVAASERQRLAREIHDVLAHTLSALAVQLEAARMVAEQRPGDPDVVARIDRAHRLTREGLEEARRAVGALRGDGLPGPEQLTRLAAGFQQESGVPCRLVIEGEPIQLKPDAQLTIYRAAQEALSNIRKHTHPAAVEMRLSYRGGGAELTVEDEGAARPSLPGGGFGLTGMRERAELLGGSLEAGPTERGFRLRLQVPAT